MAKLFSYNPQVHAIWATPNPATVVTEAATTTQKGVFTKAGPPKELLIRYLHKAKHTNPLEHAVISFRISQISRACADQLRTHRIASSTMSSTHYQDHTLVPYRVPYMLVENQSVKNNLDRMSQIYSDLVQAKCDKEHARQILPMAVEVRYILTINAVSLAHLLRLRMCFRNVVEMVMLARKMHHSASLWFPELFQHVGPACFEDKCQEGHLRCDFQTREEEIARHESEQIMACKTGQSAT